MARKFEDQDGPYDFERPVRTNSKLTTVAARVTGIAVAAAMLTGASFALTATPQLDQSSKTPVATGLDNQELTETNDVSELEDSMESSDSSADSGDHQSREISTPSKVITPTFSSDDEDDDDEGGFESEDSDHDEDSEDSEDSEDH